MQSQARPGNIDLSSHCCGSGYGVGIKDLPRSPLLRHGSSHEILHKVWVYISVGYLFFQLFSIVFIDNQLNYVDRWSMKIVCMNFGTTEFVIIVLVRWQVILISLFCMSVKPTFVLQIAKLAAQFVVVSHVNLIYNC